MLLPAVGRSSKFADVASSWIINLNQQLFQKSTLLSLRNHLFSTSSSQQSNAKVKDYLRRINYQGSLNPDLKTLATLSRIHKTTVPYTNVEFVNGTRKILDIDILHQRIVKDRGGGVCHELNGLFTWLLRELGYEVLLFNVKVYLDATKDWMEWASHSFPFVNCGEEGMYLVDPGYQLTGPMKFELLTPHSETHGIYRFRKAPETENEFYLERHRKTIYNSKVWMCNFNENDRNKSDMNWRLGELVKQGPSPRYQMNEKCDDAGSKEDLKRWKATHAFSTEPMNLEHFQAGMDKRQTNNEFTARNLILLRYYEGGYHTIFGRKYIHKLCPNPLTEVITDEVELTNDEQIHQMARDHFAYEVKDKLTIFERNLLD